MPGLRPFGAARGEASSIERALYSGVVRVALSLCLIAILGAPTSAQVNAITPQSIVRATNASRKAAGLPPLKVSAALEASANLKNEEMERLGYFGHLSPRLGSPWRFFKRVGYNYKAAGENLAKGHEDAEKLQASWMKSRHHRQNILSRRFTDIGASVNHGVVVVHFGAR